MIRKEFLTSPSPQWSGSAGAIYPLMERMERRGLIRSDPHSTGNRQSRLYRITRPGLRVFRAWLGPPHAPKTIGVPSDPLRTRIEFLTALDFQSRKVFIENAQRQLLAQIRLVEKDCRRRRAERNVPAYVVARGAFKMLQARREWLREAARLLSKLP
jgi:DNA-binding PadR family transcriptional regulator